MGRLGLLSLTFYRRMTAAPTPTSHKSSILAK